MKFTTLVSTNDLAAIIQKDDVIVVDCRFDLTDVSAGRRSYETAHVPGAVFADINEDLAAKPTGTNGRHPLPAPSAFLSTLGRLGISNDAQVIAYDQDTGMYASRFWWMLRWMGHDAVGVLDGGYARWVAEGRPTSAGIEQKTARVFHGRPNDAMVASIADVSAGPPLLDARAPERYRGDVEPIDRVAGHIPGARNHFYKDNLAADGTFRTPAELRALFARSLDDASSEDVVCYCGSGVTACHNLLALEHAGLHGARLYPGSWSEWSSDSARPVERSEK
jgi:Rhodanese-related sulfurtransferase